MDELYPREGSSPLLLLTVLYPRHLSYGANLLRLASGQGTATMEGKWVNKRLGELLAYNGGLGRDQKK